MKSIISKTMTLVAVAAALLSFSPNFPNGSGRGGEGFEIALNGKVIVQRYGNNINNVANLQFDKSSPNDKLTIRYHHCGRVGKNRIVTIKDGQDKVVKEWSFADTNEPVSPMTCYVKDILKLKKDNNSVLKLYYSSTELPKGRLLTAIVAGNNSMAKK
ncbi:MAG TPA: hypothetical protein VK489_12695 [Ferruginibacter sp.]|nr:hypothetical protein [Ferruginibacter sp.]